MAFNLFGRLSGLVPMVGINSGRCFAGNAALLGTCDVVIATENSTIGMGGPAMIEGGNLGVFRPEEVGPMDIQVPNGVVDIAVKDEAERSGRGGEKSIFPISRVRLPIGSAPTNGSCVISCRRTASGSMTSARSSRPWPIAARCWKSGDISALAWSPLSSASKAGRSASSPTTRATWPAPSIATAPTRRPVSCNFATRSIFPLSCSATHPE